MTFGLQCDEAASTAILGRAAAGGITLLDAARKARLDGMSHEYRRGDDPR